MPIPFSFSQSHAARLITSFENGGPVQIVDRPYSRPWNQNELLQLAGAALFAAFCAEPRADCHSLGGVDEPVAEVRHQVSKRHQLETLAAAIAMQYWTQLVIDEQFGEKYEPQVSAIASLAECEGAVESRHDISTKQPSTTRSGDCEVADDAGRETVEFRDTVALNSPAKPTRLPEVHLVNVVVRRGTKGGRAKLLPINVV